MRLCLTAMLAASAAIVSACSTVEPAPRVLTQLIPPEIPASARVPCPSPAILPDRDLSEREATDLWGKDRASLRVCETRRAAAVTAQAEPTTNTKGGRQ